MNREAELNALPGVGCSVFVGRLFPSIDFVHDNMSLMHRECSRDNGDTTRDLLSDQRSRYDLSVHNNSQLSPEVPSRGFAESDLSGVSKRENDFRMWLCLVLEVVGVSQISDTWYVAAVLFNPLLELRSRQLDRFPHVHLG